MDSLTSLRLFREVVECGSFAAAALRMNLSPAMASKHVARLEAQLGARLLHRSSRRLSLTEAGRTYYERSREALDILQEAEAAVGQQAHSPRGVLKVTAPVWCANPRFAAILAGYQQRCPDVVVEMHLENRRADLVEEGYDLALRATHEPSASLIARPLCRVPFVLVASPAYLVRHGRPAALAELAGHALVLPTYTSIDDLKDEEGKPIRHRAALRTGDSNLALQTVRAGIGLSYLPLWLVEEALARGEVERLFPEREFFAPTLYAAYTSRKYLGAKVRSFIDHLSQELGGL